MPDVLYGTNTTVICSRPTLTRHLYLAALSTVEYDNGSAYSNPRSTESYYEEATFQNSEYIAYQHHI